MKVLKFCFGIFFGVGLIFFVIGIVMLSNSSTEGMIETKATITNIESSCSYGYDDDDDCNYKTTISYRANGKEYTKVLTEYSSTYYEGKEITIHFDKENPNKVITQLSKFLVWMFIGMGALFILIGGIGFFVIIKNRSKAKKLKAEGNFMPIAISEVKYNSSITVNGVSPYNIICNWMNPADGIEYKFKSENLYFNPNPILEAHGIKELNVYFDISNPKRYYVDVEDLKNNK
jgi:hypothetical protein